MDRVDKLLYLSILNYQRVREFVEKSISYYTTSLSNTKNLNSKEWDGIFSVYILDSMLKNLIADADPNYIEKVNDRLVKEIAKLSSLELKTVRLVISHATELQSEPLVVPENLQITLDDKVVRLGELVIPNPNNFTKFEEIKQLMRYFLIRGFDSGSVIKFSNPDYISVCVNTLYHPGCGMFEEDVNTLGMPLSFINSLTREANLVIYLPTSGSFSQLIISEVKSYLAKFPKSNVVCIGNHPGLQYKPSLTMKQFLNSTFLVSNIELLQMLEKSATANVPEYPFSKYFMPSFDVMFQELKNIDLDVNMNWAISRDGCELGIVKRSYPDEYINADSIANIHAEEPRIHCREQNNLTQYEAWVEVISENPDVVNLSSYEKNELVYKKSRGCNVFNAALGTYIIKRFLGEGCSVLDPTSGWGERAIATFAAGGSVYRGWDTNPNLQKVYLEQKAETERVLGRQINSEIKHGAFEDDSGLFDTVYASAFDGCLMSPPFLFQEIYTGEETSTTRYNTVKKWIDGFFVPMLKACYNGIRPGGFLMAYLPSSRNYKPTDDISKLPDLSQMKPYADLTMSKLGAYYEGSLGFFTHVQGSMKKDIRETFIWRKPLSIPKKVLPKAPEIKKPIEQIVTTIHSDSELAVGTFTRGIDYFSNYKGRVVFVVSKWPSFDTEVICYACQVHEIKCIVVIEDNKTYRFNSFDANVQYVDDINTIHLPKDAIVFANGCDIPELVNIVAEKIKDLPKAERVWFFDSPGMIALMLKLYPNTTLNIVTTRKDRKPITEKMNFVFSNESPMMRARTIPSFPVNPIFDGKIWTLFNADRQNGDLLWINK